MYWPFSVYFQMMSSFALSLSSTYLSLSHNWTNMCDGENKSNTCMYSLAWLAMARRRAYATCNWIVRQNSFITLARMQFIFFAVLFFYKIWFGFGYTLNNPVCGAAWSLDKLYPVQLRGVEIMQASWSNIMISPYKPSQCLLATREINLKFSSYSVLHRRSGE